MGAHPYFYFTKYQPDIDTALQELREQEFQAGRYNPVLPFMDFPIGPDSPAPGPEHESIDEARDAAAEDGTRSILDIDGIADDPDFSVATPLSDEDLKQYFGTTQPTKEMVLKNMDFLESIERGYCIYITVFVGDKPAELFFAGYSFD